MMARARQLPGSDAARSTRCSRVVRVERRPDRPGAAQGVGQPAAVGAAADLDHRLAPAQGGRAWPSRWPAPVDWASTELPADAIVLCSFGDASVNHATALAGFNAARYGARIGCPMPILFVCEDNGIGIACRHARRAGSRRRSPPSRTCATSRAEGELDELWDAVAEAVARRAARRARRCSCTCDVVRLWGHAGSDAEHGVPHARRDRGDRGAGSAADERASPGRDRRRHARPSCAALVRRHARARQRRRRGGDHAARSSDHDRRGRGAARARTIPSGSPRRAARADPRPRKRASRLRRRAARGRRRAHDAHAGRRTSTARCPTSWRAARS